MQNSNPNYISIPEFYNGKSVFITGGMGFIGKVMVEKLLRSCPGIENIYLLARAKKGKSMDERLAEIIKSPVFDNLRKINPDAAKKISLIEGDNTLPELGISKENQKLLCDKVAIVLHTAATISFNEPIRVAIETNVRSVREMMKLCRQIKNLESFIHVSTSYTNWFELGGKEEFYPPQFDPNGMIEMCKTLPDDILKKITPDLLGKHTNTYTFSKALAENLIYLEHKDLPVSIVRPSVTVASLREPFPGWIDNFGGPTYYFMLVGKGFMKHINAIYESKANIVPVDIVSNAIIAAAWETALTPKPEVPKIYLSCTGASNKHSIHTLFKDMCEEARKNPFEGVVWYPTVRFVTNLNLYRVVCGLTEYLPAYMIDAVQKAFGKKPRMVKITDTYRDNWVVSSFASLYEINFKHKNTDNLLSKMSEEDKQTFDFDPRKFVWKDFSKTYHLGIRQHLLKQDPKTIPACVEHMKKLKIRHNLLKGTAAVLTLFAVGKVAQSIVTNKSTKNKLDIIKSV